MKNGTKIFLTVIIGEALLILFLGLIFTGTVLKNKNAWRSNQKEYISKYEEIEVYQKDRTEISNIDQIVNEEKVEEAILSEEETTYLEACKKFNNGYYEEAKLLFDVLNNYRDAEEMAFECDYMRADSLLSMEQYKEARDIYAFLGQYKDSQDCVVECDYQRALVLEVSGKLVEARDILTTINDYKDSKNLIKKYTFDIAEKYFKSNEIEKAKEEYSKYPDTKEGKCGLFNVEMVTVRDLILEGKYTEAGEIMAAVSLDAASFEENAKDKFSISEDYSKSLWGYDSNGEPYYPFLVKEYKNIIDMGLLIMFVYDENSEHYSSFQVNVYTPDDSMTYMAEFDSQGKPYFLTVSDNGIYTSYDLN